MPNTEQAKAWNGESGLHWATHQDRFDTLLSRLTVRLVVAAGIREEDGVLDVGCGCGETTRIAARQASRGTALGLDLSGPMLERARARAGREGIGNVAFEKGDAQVARLPEEAFDLVMSRFGVMFFDDPAAAFANLFRSLRPGGRVAFLCWRELSESPYWTVPRNVFAAFVALPEPEDGPGPFSLGDPARVRGLLTGAGFGDVALDPVDELVCPGSDAADAAGFLMASDAARSIFTGADEAIVAEATEALRTALRPYETLDGVLIRSAAWLVTARRL